jgi:hypothetical protein
MADDAKPDTHRLATSVRIVIEGLAVVGICWLANSVQQQNVSIVRLQTQIAQVQSSLADVPKLTQSLAAMRVQIAEHERRIGRIEDGSDNPKLRGWTR